MKTYKNLVAGLVSLSVMASCLVPAPVVMASTSSNHQSSVWESFLNDYGEKVVSAFVTGRVVSRDGKHVSNDAYLGAYVMNNEVTFCLSDADAIVENLSGKDMTLKATCRLTETGLDEVSVPLSFANGTGLMQVTGEFPGSTISYDTLFINEWTMDGDLEIILYTDRWNGEADRVLYFDIPSSNGEFISLSRSETVTAQEKTCRYTDRQVLVACQDYIDRFNDVVPYANQLYESLNNENAWTGLLGSTLALTFGVTPFANFLEAKKTYEALNPAEMTSEQYSVYVSTESAVNATTLGQIIVVIDYLIDIGLLS